MKNKKLIYNIIAIIICIAALIFLEANKYKYSYITGILVRVAIYSLVAVSMNLVTGFTGLFSLGQAGFMAIGAYTVGIFTIPIAQRSSVYYMNGISPLIENIYLPFGIALILGGIFAALCAALLCIPVLSLKSDYLSIDTM